MKLANTKSQASLLCRNKSEIEGIAHHASPAIVLG